MVAFGARLEPLLLECSRPKDRCVLSGGRRTAEWFPVSEALRFEVRSGGSRPELLAVTTRESIPLLRGDRADLEDRAAELNTFLREPAQERWVLRYDPREDLRRWGLPLLVLLNALVVLLGLLWVKGRTTVFDRARGVAIRVLGPIRATRRLDAFRSIHVRSLAEEEPRPWYLGRGHVDVGALRRIVLVAENGASWPVTPYENQRFARSDLDAVAAELAEFLGLPVT